MNVGCKHIRKTKENNYSGTLLQYHERSLKTWVCHECWMLFDIDRLTGNISKGYLNIVSSKR